MCMSIVMPRWHTWHGVGPEADVVHVAKQEEGEQSQNVGLVEQLKELAADVLH